MKTNLLRKLAAITLVLSMIMSMFVIADAAVISSETWSKDFEGMNDVSYNQWLNPSYTSLDCTFYGATTSVISIKSDTDVTHGKIMNVEVDPSDSSERFVAFTFPLISTGKFVFEFDVKTAGPDMIFSANKTDHTGYNGVFKMSGNAISDVNNTNTYGTYNLNEWKTFRVLFDVDKKQITTYVDGESNTTTSAYETTQCMKFIVRSGEGGISFDNLKFYPVTGTTVTMEAFAEGQENKSFVDIDAEYLTLALGDSSFASVPNIKMVSLGEDILSDADDEEMDIDAVYNNGDINITLNDYMEEGYKYRISIPNGTKDMFGRTIENTNVEFYALSNNGWIDGTKIEEDFAIDSLPSSGAFGTSGNFYYVQGNTAFALVKDSKYSGGTALQLNNGAHAETSAPNWRKGKIHLETKMDLGMGAYVRYDTSGWNTNNLFFGQKAVDLTGDGVNDEAINFMKQAPSATHPNTLWDSRKLKTGDLEVIEYIIDIDNLKSYITYNGESFTLDFPYATGNGVDIKNTGFNSFRLYGGAEPMIIDYFNYRHEYIPAAVKEIKATNVTEGKVDVKSQLVITFTEAMKEDTLSNITVKNGEENVKYKGVWDATANTYTLTFDSNLKPETAYAVTIPDTVQDYSKLPVYEAFGTFTTAPIPPMDVKNIAAVWSKASNSVSVSADVINPTDAIVSMVVAGYKGTVMETIEIIPVTILASTTNISESVTLTETDIDTVKAFALYDLSSIRPYCPAATATVQ